MSDSSSTKLIFSKPCRLCILCTSSFACCPWNRVPDTHSTRFGSLPHFQHSSSSSLLSLAATLTSARLFVVYHKVPSQIARPPALLEIHPCYRLIFSSTFPTPPQAACQEASRNHPNRCGCHLFQQRRQMQRNSH